MNEDIVVGIDGSSGARQALRWALAEAAWRQVPVRLVHAVKIPPDAPAYRYSFEYSNSSTMRRFEEGLIKAGQEVAETALEEAGGAPSGVPVQSFVKVGSAANVLVDESRDAALLVV